MRSNDFKFEKMVCVVKDMEKWVFFKENEFIFLKDNLENI